MIDVSVVVPVHDEAAVVEELVARCAAALASPTRSFELVLVDDASTDDTPRILRDVARRVPELEPVRLDVNAGQFGATRAGLARARGALVAVLDGDLQDPPELLGELCRELEASGDRIDVVYAVKAERQERGAFIAGQAAYHALARLAGSRAPPPGAGSFCVMRAPWAERVARVSVRHANLAAVLAALGARGVIIPYAKAARYDDASRVGFVGLGREALGSLVLTGAASRLLRFGAVASGALGWLVLGRRRALGLAGLALASGLLIGARAADRWARARLSQSRST